MVDFKSRTKFEQLILATFLLIAFSKVSAARRNDDLDTNPCGPIPVIPNAKLMIVMKPTPTVADDGADTALRKRVAKITYQCDKGYVAKNNITEVSCNEEFLMWNELPSCIPNNTCGPAPEIDDGEIVWRTFIGLSGYGDQVSYECSRVYMLTGNATITCQLDGRWSRIPNCGTPANLGCGSPPSFPFYSIIGKSFSDDRKTVGTDYVAYGCQLGYVLVDGPSVLKCNGTHWNPAPPRCIPWPDRGCGPAPWVENAQVRNRSFANSTSGKNDFVIYACNPGFYTSDDPTVICSDNGRWSTLPECQPMRACDYPPIVRHGRVYQKSYTLLPLPNSKVTYICFTSYKMIGPQNITCRANYTWSQPPRCEEEENFFCPPVQPVQNALIEFSSFTADRKPKPGDTVIYSCLEKYRMIGSRLSRCLVSLRWSSRPVCVPDVAPAPPMRLMTGIVPAAETTTPSNLFCDKAPTHPNAIIVAQSFGIAPKPGDIVVYQCDDGYERAKGSSTSLLCVQNSWIGSIRCEPRPDSCSSPLSIPNTKILSRSFSGNRGVPKDNVTYACDTGFVPVNTRGTGIGNGGIKTIISRCADGKWSNLPICVPTNQQTATRRDCPGSPPELRRASIIGTGYSTATNDDGRFFAGDFAVYQCLGNMTLASSFVNSAFYIPDDDRNAPPIASVICRSNGTWSETPICNPPPDRPMTCGPVPNFPPNIIVLTAEGVVGSPPNNKLLSQINDYVQLDCKPGFELNGTVDRITCLENGTWSAPPNCVAVTCGLMPPAPDKSITLFQSFTGMSTSKDFIIYKCRSGYRLLNGTDRTTCSESGNWTTLPVCQRIIPERVTAVPVVTCTLPVPLPTDAVMVYSSFDNADTDRNQLPRVGDFVVYGCPSGYSAMGNTTVTCQLGGVWSKASPCMLGTSGAEDFRGGKLRGPQCLKGITDYSHTSCLDDSPDLRSIRPLNVREILDLHNQYRLSVTPAARNMKNLSWDDELAITAERWAAQCSTSNDDGKNRAIMQKGWRWIGQNIFAAANEFTATQGINSWADQRRFWAYGVGSKNPGEIVGHYTQIIWAQTLYVGCGMAKCDTLRTPLSHVIVCNYAPGGNTAFVGQNPYATPYELLSSPPRVSPSSRP